MTYISFFSKKYCHARVLYFNWTLDHLRPLRLTPKNIRYTLAIKHNGRLPYSHTPDIYSLFRTNTPLLLHTFHQRWRYIFEGNVGRCPAAAWFSFGVQNNESTAGYNYVTHVNEGTDILARKFCITTSDLCIYIIKEYILICIERDIFRILRKKMRFTFF